MDDYVIIKVLITTLILIVCNTLIFNFNSRKQFINYLLFNVISLFVVYKTNFYKYEIVVILVLNLVMFLNYCFISKDVIKSLITILVSTLILTISNFICVLFFNILNIDTVTSMRNYIIFSISVLIVCIVLIRDYTKVQSKENYLKKFIYTKRLLVGLYLAFNIVLIITVQFFQVVSKVNQLLIVVLLLLLSLELIKYMRLKEKKFYLQYEEICNLHVNEVDGVVKLYEKESMKVNNFYLLKSEQSKNINYWGKHMTICKDLNNIKSRFLHTYLKSKIHQSIDLEIVCKLEVEGIIENLEMINEISLTLFLNEILNKYVFYAKKYEDSKIIIALKKEHTKNIGLKLVLEVSGTNIKINKQNIINNLQVSIKEAKQNLNTFISPNYSISIVEEGDKYKITFTDER